MPTSVIIHFVYAHDIVDGVIPQDASRQQLNTGKDQHWVWPVWDPAAIVVGVEYFDGGVDDMGYPTTVRAL